jgi:hypothetical protein
MPIKADKAVDKVCKRVVMPLPDNFQCRYEVVDIYCIAHRCMFWTWDTDDSGRCAKKEAAR